jgi:hypothetical protein
MTLYVVERWLARLSASPYADQFVIKGGMVLAAYDARRPTADLDALARSVANDEAAVLSRVAEIARLAPSIDDGVVYRTETATARVRVASVIRLFGAARQRRRSSGNATAEARMAARSARLEERRTHCGGAVLQRDVRVGDQVDVPVWVSRLAAHRRPSPRTGVPRRRLAAVPVQ